MTQRYDIIATRPGKDGKANYVKIGVMFPATKGNGFSIKLDALPLPNEKGEVWINAWEPREKGDAPPRSGNGGRGQATRQQSSYDDDLADSVPF